MNASHRSGPPTWLGPIRQTAFVVDDTRGTAQQWADTHGVGPWFLYDVAIDATWYRGATVPFRASMGLAHTGGQQIELIQPDRDVPSIYNEFAESGAHGVHHVCYWTEIGRAVDHFRSQGADVVQSGTTASGNEFVYLSGSCAIPYVELVDPKGAMRTFFDGIERAATDWDGADPLR